MNDIIVAGDKMKMKYLMLIASAIFAILSLVFGILSYNNSDFYYAFGFSIGITIVFVIITLILFISKNNFDSYDERQIRARGECFKVAFFVFGFVMLIDAILRDSLDNYIMEHMMSVFLAFVISILVFVTIAIFKDAYFYVTQENKSKPVAIGFTLLGLGNFILGLVRIVIDGPIVDGVLNIAFMNILCALMFAVIGVDVLIKRMLDKKQDSEED